MSSGVLPHRMDRSYYMSGHSANIVGKQDISSRALEEMKNAEYAEKLFYGRGLALPSGSPRGGPQSRAMQKFEVRLKTALERNRDYGDDVDTVWYSQTSRGVTPGPTIREDPREHAESKRQTFVTETRT